MTELPGSCVLDASVGIRLFLPEEHSEDVQRLFEECLADPDRAIYVPDLFLIECANVLWKKVQRGEYAEEAAKANVADLKALGLLTTPTEHLVERALEIACATRITAYDACYVALSEAQGVPLLTADSRLAEVPAKSGFSVVALGG